MLFSPRLPAHWRCLLFVILFGGICHELRSEEAAKLLPRQWQVDGVTREALVYAPQGRPPVAAVLVFHGHGGSMNQARLSFALHHHWPEAVVIYMQGLKTPGALTDPEGHRAGWQKKSGDMEDRDLRFTDEVLKSIVKDYHIDPTKCFAAGHSNGAAFSYLLWTERAEKLGAFAASGASLSVARQPFKATPRPVFHIAGKDDPLVKYIWQMQTVKQVLDNNLCQSPEPWPEHPECLLYASRTQADVVLYEYDGGHRMPETAGNLMAAFFKRVLAPAPQTSGN